MELVEIKGKSKKTGKDYTGYCVKIGEYTTPIFFPSKIELMYIKNRLNAKAHKEFQDDYLNGDDLSYADTGEI